MQAIAELRGWAPLVALQIPYSLTERTVERELLPVTPNPAHPDGPVFRA